MLHICVVLLLLSHVWWTCTIVCTIVIQNVTTITRIVFMCEFVLRKICRHCPFSFHLQQITYWAKMIQIQSYLFLVPRLHIFYSILSYVTIGVYICVHTLTFSFSMCANMLIESWWIASHWCIHAYWTDSLDCKSLVCTWSTL